MTDLSVVDPDLGFAPCPYAKKAFIDKKLLVIECLDREDLWKTISGRCKNFSDKHSVIICFEEEPSQTYKEVEAACIAMNEWFAYNKMDVWLLAFQTNFTMVFIQRLSELDDASQKLEKMGYYESYDPSDYVKLILNRRYQYRRYENGRCQKTS